MLGNLHEYCADRYDANFYKVSPKVNPFVPMRNSMYDLVVSRGGSYSSFADECRTSARYEGHPEDIGSGFRLALSFEQ